MTSTDPSIRQPEADLLRALAGALAQPYELRDVLRQALDGLVEQGGWSVAHLYLAGEEEPAELRSALLWAQAPGAAFHRLRLRSEAARFTPGVGLVGHVQATARAGWWADVSREPAFVRRDGGLDLGVRAGAMIPVRAGARVVGVLECFRATAAEADEGRLRVLELVAALLGQAVERERLAAELHAHEALRRTAAAILAHEINNPLCAARSALALLEGELGEAGVESCFVGVAQEELARIAAVMAQLPALLRTERGYGARHLPELRQSA